MLTRTRRLAVNGIHMQFQEAGEGPLLLLCHGFPETWHAWRHQIPALVRQGYRVIIPDLRGFGGTDAPSAVEDYNILYLVGDIVDLVGQLGEAQAIIIGHDCGATLAWNAALMRPDIFRAVAALSIPFRQRGATPPVRTLIESGMENFYWVYFQTPGIAEAEFESDVRSALRRLYYGASGDAPADHRLRLALASGKGFLDGIPEPEAPLDWLETAALDIAVAEFTRTGFRGGLNWYRNFDRNWELTAPWIGGRVSVPALFIAGTEEPFFQMAAGRAALDNLGQTVPGLRRKVSVTGAGHWVQQERPAEVNAALSAFLVDLSPAPARRAMSSDCSAP